MDKAKKLEIAIFGASVTKQKNGYAAKLKSMFSDDVHIFGYGGMHLNDAGICFIDNVLEKNPQFCFIDWFSTAYCATNEKTIEYIDTIIHKFSMKKCKLIFLFFPRQDDEKREFFYLFCKQHLNNKNIYYIDLNSDIHGYNVDDILRDIVHTNDNGSKLYADIIYDRFKNDLEKIKIPHTTLITKYNEIKKKEINKVFNNSIELKGKCEIIGFLLTIGPHSGVIEVVNGEKYNTWDKYCYYPRKNIKLPLILNKISRIDILQENFCTGDCCVEYDFSKKIKKLIIHEIYYIGDFLKINNESEGKKIYKIYNFSSKIIGRIKRLITKLRTR